MAPLFKAIATIFALYASTLTALAQERAKIVTVNYPLKYLAERLIGENGEVVFPVPEGIDPSFWRPSIADVSMIQSADLIVLNGAGFATWVDRVTLPRSRLVNTTAAVEQLFITTESITHSHGDGGEHSHEATASFTWLDPTLAIAQAEAIAGVIAARGLASPGDIYANFAELRADLKALDKKTKSALEGAKDIAMIATHPRYQYFARRYGLSIASVAWAPGAMPSETEMAELRVLVENTQASVLIWEAAPPVEALEATNALGLRSVVFDPMATASSGNSFIASVQASVSELSAAVTEILAN
ncbi:MAG: zinc ABC transporter substrate-binding protein [Pseudomonadota bacterium]